MKKIFFIAIAAILIVSCRKKMEWPSWDVEVLFPLAGTTMQISDIVKDSSLALNSDQSYTLVYSGEIFKVRLDTLFLIPDTSVSQSFKCPFCGPGWPYAANFPMFNQLQETKYSLGDVELMEAVIRSGSIEVELSSTLQVKTLLTYELPYAKDIYGNSLIVTDTLPAASPGNPTVKTKSYNLDGYRVDLRGKNGNSYNTLVSHLKAFTLESGTVTATDSVRVFNAFKNVIPEYARGYFGQSFIEVKAENQAVQKIHNITGGSFNISDFNLILKIRNGVGADIQFKPKTVTSLNNSGIAVQLASPVLGTTININPASLINNSSIYPPVVYSEYLITMNSLNSNADELVEIFPDSISASAEIVINPLGNNSNSNDFVYYGNGIDISLNAEIPFALTTNNLVFADTVAIDFAGQETSGDDAVKKILGGNLILDVYNGYPFSAIPQLYLMDESFNILDSLAESSSVIKAADLNSNNYSSEKKFSKVKIPIDQGKIEKLRLAKNLMIKLTFTTSSQTIPLKIYSEYEVDIKVVADINYLIENN